MLRKLKQAAQAQVNATVNAVNATVNSEPRHEALVNDSSFTNPNAEIDASNEGFLCPVCMVSFSTPDDLQDHFPTHSSSPTATLLSPPSHQNSYFEDLNDSAKLENLKAQILAEKRYSSELKKEFDRLQSVLAASTDVPDGEVPYLLQQIQALEAGKSILTQRLLEVERDLQGAQRDKKDVISRLSELSHTMKQLRESNDELSSAREIACEDVQRYQGLVDILERDKKELEAHLAQRPSEDDVTVLRKELIHSQRLMDQITEQKEEEIREHLQTIENLKREQTDHQTIIDDLRTQVQKSAVALQNAEAKGQNSSTHVKKAAEDCDEKETAIANLTKERLSAAVERLEAAERKALQLSAELEEREKQLSEQAGKESRIASEFAAALAAAESLKELIAQKDCENEQLRSKIGDLETEMFSCNEHFKSKTLHFEEQIERSHEHNEELLAKINKAETHTANLEKALAEKRKGADEKEILIEDLQKQIAQLELDAVRCNDLTTEVAETKKSWEALSERNEALQKSCEETNASIESSRIRCSELSDQLKVANDEKEFLLTTLHEKEKFASDKLGDRERQITELSENLKAREREKELLQEELDELKRFKEQNEKEIENFSKSLQQMELSLSEKSSEIESLNVVRVGIGEELDSLREQLTISRSSEENQSRRCAELHKELTDTQDKAIQQLSIQNALQKEMEELKNSFQTFKEESAAKLKEKEDSLQATIAQRNKQVEELTTRMNVLQKELEEKSADVDRLGSELNKVRTNCTDMEKKLKTFGEERKGLMERCVRVESDLEFERDRAMENKRRFDDALSAMHELGRANQSLQIDMSKQFNRKWLDDSEALNCFHCGKQFSLTLRKHHCRSCGQIFCAPCSAQTAQVASSKKPVRVCFNCHTELSSR